MRTVRKSSKKWIGPDSLGHRLRRQLALRVWDPLYWGLVKRSQYRRILAEFRVLQHTTAADARQRERTALSLILEHALTRIPYYRERELLSKEEIAADPILALGKFPLLDRNTVIRELPSLQVEMGRGTFTNASGGSTGMPVRIVQDRVYLDHSLAAGALFLEWAGLPPRSRIANLWGAPRDIGGRKVSLRRRVGDWLANSLTLNAFEMQPSDLRDYLRELRRFRPCGLVGYADALLQLARFCQENQLRPEQPEAVISAASTLTTDMREQIESVFGCPVFDRYGTREVGPIAMECGTEDGLHVLTEVAHVEIVDDLGNEVPLGEEGELLITTLNNYTMPLIRYRVGDRAIRGSEACSCGRPYPRIEKILGRNEACFRTPSGGRVMPEFFIHLIGKEHNYGDLEKFQFIQDSLTHIELRMQFQPGAEERILADAATIEAKIKRAMGSSCVVTMTRVDSIPPTASGKHLYTICRV